MATYTDNYQLTLPGYADVADVADLNHNATIIDEIMHSSQISLADAYDSTQTYNAGEVVMYNYKMYKCITDGVTGTWDPTKWERTTAAETGGEASDLSVKVPEVISTGDKACYVKRAIPTAGALAEGQKIVGATLAWNQLVQNGNFASTSNWNNQNSTATANNNEMTITPTAAYGGITQDLAVTAGHKVLYMADLYCAEIQTGDAIRLQMWDGSNYKSVLMSESAKWTKMSFIYDFPSNATNNRLMIVNNKSGSAGSTFKAKNTITVDLTQLFGSTIADAIYQMEQTTAGSGVAFFRKYFSKDYYDYDAGTLESVNVSAHKAYDSNAAEVSSITLDSSKEFRGLYKLVDGELRADGDVYEADGTVTRKYGIVDLSSLTWNTTTANRWWTTPQTYIKPAAYSAVFNGISSNYAVMASSVLENSSVNGISVGGASNIYCRNGSTTTPPTGFLVYELATPTTESATPYTNPQLVDADGTEEFVDYGVSQGNRDVAIPVGHESSFYDYTDGTITIPDLPFADGTYALAVSMSGGTPTYKWEVL